MSDLSEVDWREVLTCMDLDGAVSSFTYKFKQVLDKHAPWVVFQYKKNIAKRCSRRPLFKTLILFVSHQTSLKVMRTDSHTHRHLDM